MESPAMLTPTANVVRPSSPPLIQRSYILLKAHYFLFFSSFGMVYPILNITLRARGLSNTELSFINIIIPFLVFLANPALGFIADRSRRYLLTFSFVLAIATVLFSAMFLLPVVKTHHIQATAFNDPQLGRVLDFCASQEVVTKCASRSECGCSYEAKCATINQKRDKEYFRFTFSMNSNNIMKELQDATNVDQPVRCGIQYRVPIAQAIRQIVQKNNSDPFSRHTDPSQPITCVITCSIPHFCHGSRYANQLGIIALYSVLFILGNTLLSNSIPLGASIGFATVSNPDHFGAQRVFGTVGFGIAAFVASRIYQIFKTDLVYIIMFSITTTICIIVTCFIRIRTIVHEKELDDLSVEKKKKKKKKSHSRLSTLIPLLKKVDIIIFLSLTLIWGMSYAGLDPYLYLYVDEFAVCKSHAIVGWMALVASIAEIIGFFLAAKLIKLLGTNLTSIVILLAFTIRFGGYYFIRQPYFLISMETMHFFNFGILYVLIAQKADSIAPPGLAGTLQGIALGVAFGLGRGVGLPIASFIYTSFEQRILFLVIAIFNLTAAVIYSIYFLITRSHSEKSIESNDDQIIVTDDVQSKTEPLLVVSTKTPIDEQ